MALHRILAALTIALLALSVATSANAESESRARLRGSVESGGTGLAGYEVSLYARFVEPFGVARVLGRATTSSSGEFEIDYHLPPGLHSSFQPLLFILAESGPAMLASAIGRAPVAGTVVVNERTTVATGFAFAQFVDGSAIGGNRYGMFNAVRMAANMVDPRTGAVAAVLSLPPNGSETTALRTFNSLANIVAYCISTHVGCQDLFNATTVPSEARPRSVLQAVANIAKYPWLNVAQLFNLSFKQPIFEPALQDQPPDAWTLFLKFTGSFSSVQDPSNLLDGPGNIAIDREGFLWVNDNYIPQLPNQPACAGTRLLKFYPWGENFPGSPYFGGGLSGSGWGISIAPNGLIWVSNFGFAGTGCPEPSANSVSVFLPDGKALSGDAGLTAGPISWPQGIVPDRQGNIWIANCGADSVTIYPKGQPGKAFEIPIPRVNAGPGRMKPFGLAIDHQGNAWATGSFNSTLAVIAPEGKVIEVIPSEDRRGRTQLSRPMGVASDSHGNIWVANSDFSDVPCPPNIPDEASATAPSIALFLRAPDHKPYADSPFTGGGLTIPWGIAVDGNDTVWVANFGFPFDLANPEGAPAWPAPNRVSHFCGVDPSKCPPTKRGIGRAISPQGTGYTSDALDRNTGIAIDPSGNVWLANNWKPTPLFTNPGGNSIVVLVGVAAPVQTPLIGTPQAFARGQDGGRRAHAD